MVGLTERPGDGISQEDVLEVIDEVEEKVVDECKLGATRDQIAEGTCERIRRRIHELGGSRR